MKHLRIPSALAAAAAVIAVATGCGTREMAVPKQDPTYEGAVIFSERCAGCHTLDAAVAQGSKPPRQISSGERTNGPNFNVRRETREEVLFAIRNGGFSGAIMPANIVVGDDAQKVADFLAKWAGRKVAGGAKERTDEGPGRTRNPTGS